MTTNTDFYATPGPMTNTTEIDAMFLDGIPTSDIDLCAVSKNLIIHEFLVGAYGVGDVSDRLGELENRTAMEIVETIAGLDPRPLVEPRPPSTRMIGNCRQYTVLTCGLLRRAGIPARARAGFSGYFDDSWVDHWIVERWDGDRMKWVRSDTQIDDTLRGIFQIDFDPLDVPVGRFLTGSEAWLRYRDGDDDPQRFGIQDMRGPWFIAASVIRDLAALNKVEVHVWDTWGLIDEVAFHEPTEEQTARIDEIAEAVIHGTHEDITHVYDQPGLMVPGTVTSNRFQRRVDIPQVESV